VLAIDNTKVATKVQDEFTMAKPFKSAPRLTIFNVIRRFLPGGELLMKAFKRTLFLSEIHCRQIL